MAEQQPNPPGPDLTKGVSVADIAAGQMLLGHVNQDAVLLARQGDEFFAIGATCSHYSGPLAEGLMAGDTVRCPWHHARFSLRTGEAIGAPAFNALPCWRVEKSDDKVFVRERTAPADRSKPSKPAQATAKPDRIVIVGGGAAGFAAAEMLRREGFGGSLTLVSADDEPPYDRPNCSKDYLAGSAPEDWMPLKPAEFYKEYSIDLQLGSEVTAIDSGPRQVALANGRKIAFDKLLLATGAEPVRLQHSGRGSAACPRSALAFRRARHHRQRNGGAARRCHRRKLHRLRGCGRTADEEPGCSRRRAGTPAAGAHPRSGIRRFYSRTPRRARRRFPLGGYRHLN